VDYSYPVREEFNGDIADDERHPDMVMMPAVAPVMMETAVVPHRALIGIALAYALPVRSRVRHA
jgi:hypothetical protein